MGNLLQLQQTLEQNEIVHDPNGSRYFNGMFGQFDCVRYTAQGIEFRGKDNAIDEIQDDEILLYPTSVSLCGTDLALIDKAKSGGLPDEAIGKIVGHEAAGFIVGLGKQVTKWKLGQYVCLDSHVACEQLNHHSFDDCVQSGKSCDGIVGGIRGVLNSSGAERLDPPTGYWSRMITVSQSAIPMIVPVEIAEKLKAPSTLESLGNLYMIQELLRDLELLNQPERTVCIVVGLGATGYPMAAVASHTGFQVFGVNPSEAKRSFAVEQGAVSQAFETIEEAMVAVDSLSFENLVIIVTADAPSAHESALFELEKMGESVKRKICVLFGLYADPLQPIKGAPKPFDSVPQREFVFGRKNFTSANGVETYGVCGRDLRAWSSALRDLDATKNKRADRLIQMLNAAQLQVDGADALESIALLLQERSSAVELRLKETGALKLVANLAVTELK